MSCIPANCMSPLILFSGLGAVTVLHITCFCVCMREECYLWPLFKDNVGEFMSVMFFKVPLFYFKGFSFCFGGPLQ